MVIDDQILKDPAEEPALAMIEEKIADFPAVLRSNDRVTGVRAIEAVSLMKTVPPELAPDLITCGRNTTISLIGFARSKGRAGWRDLRAEEKVYWFFREWDEKVMARLALNPTDAEQRLKAIEAIENEVKDERDSFLAEVGDSARTAKARRSTEP